MWNLKSINPICQRKQIVSDQERLLTNVYSAKKRVDNSTPWRPSHSLSKWSNKYKHQEDEKIVLQNNILLSKMMDIQKNNSKISQGQSLGHISNQHQRKFEKQKINSENMKFLQRLQSASSIYNKQYWQPDDQKNQQYKQIILRRTKLLNQDYDDLARKSLESRSTGRLLSSQQARRKQNFNQQQSDELLQIQ